MDGDSGSVSQEPETSLSCVMYNYFINIKYTFISNKNYVCHHCHVA